MVCVTLRGAIDGKLLELPDVDPQIFVFDLKRMIAQYWRVPPRCQKLIMGKQILLDSQQLSGHCPLDGTALELVMFVSLEEVLHDLSAVVNGWTGVHLRTEALETLVELQVKGDENVISAVSAQLEQCNPLRQAAVAALSAVAEKGDERATAEVTMRLECHCDGVTMRQALAQVAEKGNERAIAEVAMRLEHRDDGVRRAAVEALAQVAEKGNERAIAAVTSRLEHRDDGVRRAAVEALAQVAEKGNERAIAGVTTCLEDRGANVRRAAVEALKHNIEFVPDSKQIFCSRGGCPCVATITGLSAFARQSCTGGGVVPRSRCVDITHSLQTLELARLEDDDARHLRRMFVTPNSAAQLKNQLIVHNKVALKACLHQAALAPVTIEGHEDLVAQLPPGLVGRGVLTCRVCQISGTPPTFFSKECLPRLAAAQRAGQLPVLQRDVPVARATATTNFRGATKLKSGRFQAACNNCYIGLYASDVEAYEARRQWQRAKGLTVDPPAARARSAGPDFRSSQHVGVCLHSATGRWQARLRGKYLGLFNSEEAAVEAIRAARIAPPGA